MIHIYVEIKFCKMGESYVIFHSAVAYGTTDLTR